MCKPSCLEGTPPPYQEEATPVPLCLGGGDEWAAGSDVQDPGWEGWGRSEEGAKGLHREEVAAQQAWLSG